MKTPQAHDVVKGVRAHRTAVVLHGVMGSSRNLASFAKSYVTAQPEWQCILLDLRCHGRTAAMTAPGANTIGSCAADVLRLLDSLHVYPDAVIGHCFGGRVALEAVNQVGRSLPRGIQVWVLDLPPAGVRVEKREHPRDIIELVRQLPPTQPSRKALVELLQARGLGPAAAAFMTTNVRSAGADGAVTWSFDIEGIRQLYSAFEAQDMWPALEGRAQGVDIHFVRAERSPFLWAEEDLARIERAGASVHNLAGAGHWVARPRSPLAQCLSLCLARGESLHAFYSTLMHLKSSCR